VAAVDHAVQVANSADRRTRMHPLKEEQLRSVERAETREVSLIQQCFTDRAIGLSRDPPHSLVGVPVRSEQVWAEMAYDGVLSRCRNELEDGKPVSHYIMIIGSEYRSDFKGRSATPAPSAWIDLPDAIHPEVSVQSERIAQPEQLMLASRGHLAYGNAREIGRCQGGHPKFRPRQLAASEHFVQPLACPPDGVSLRHGLIVPCHLREPGSCPSPLFNVGSYPMGAKTVLPSHAKGFDLSRHLPLRAC
jgi:hypothetical protein